MPMVGGVWKSQVQAIIELKQKYPHHVDIKNYRQLKYEGKAPRESDIGNGATWVKRRNKRDIVRTFGFKTIEEANLFREKWGLVAIS